MSELKNITGTEAVAYAAQRSYVQVVPAYPITPQTTIVEYIANFVANGDMDAEYIHVESEHSAMAASIAAASKGVRTFTATSSQGLLYMHEMIHWASGARLPIVMVNVSRALAPPWNIYNDHQDYISQRDTGWIQLFAETNQEALDMTLQAFKIAENPDVRVPVMVNIDGFTLSHTYEPVDIPSQEEVDKFLSKPNLEDPLSPGDLHTINNVTTPEHYIQFKYRHNEAVKNSKGVIRDVGDEFEEKFQRASGGLFETYRTDGADTCLLTVGSLAGTARVAIDEMKEEGEDVGLIILKSYRPLPRAELQELAGDFSCLAVLEKNYSKGQGGAIATEIKSALYESTDRPSIFSYIGGLGGRDISVSDIKGIMNSASSQQESGKVVGENWVGIKGRN